MRSRTVTCSVSTLVLQIGRARLVEHRAERRDQLEQSDLDLALLVRRRHRPGTDHAEHVAPEQPPLRERLRDLLEALVFEQPLHQIGPRIDAPRPSSSSSPGRSIRLLISARVAAMTRYSAAMSRSSSCISSIVARYCSAMRAIGMSVMSTSVLSDQVEQEVEGTLERRELDGIPRRGRRSARRARRRDPRARS
jgi:hypothetical protein